MKGLSNKTDINKGKEVPSINLNLQTEVAQYLVQQGQAKEGGAGESNKNKYMFFLFFFYKCKRKTAYKAKYANNKNKAKLELCYATTKQTLEFPKVSINPTWKEGLHKRQVNYIGKVKLTKKKEGNKDQ